jgi:hypothetical protein
MANLRSRLTAVAWVGDVERRLLPKAATALSQKADVPQHRKLANVVVRRGGLASDSCSANEREPPILSRRRAEESAGTGLSLRRNETQRAAQIQCWCS